LRQLHAYDNWAALHEPANPPTTASPPIVQHPDTVIFKAMLPTVPTKVRLAINSATDVSVNLTSEISSKRNAGSKHWTLAQAHGRYGHCGKAVMRKLGFAVSDSWFCEPCSAKLRQKNVSKYIRPKANIRGEHVYMDIAGKLPTSVGGYKYVLGFTDSYSQMSWSFPMKKKSDVSRCLRELLLILRKDNVSIQTLHTDNDSVFKDKKFGATCSHASIHINFSAPGDQWQNGCAESFVGRCKFLGSAALAAANLGEEYTVFAMLNAAHVGNFLPNTLHPECPLDRWTGKVNNHAHLRTFGSECYVYDAGHQGLQPRSLKALYLGDASHVGQGSYSRGTYRVQVLSTGKQRTSRHVLFDETVVPDCPRATERALRLHDEWVQALKHDPHAWDDPTQPATDSSVELPAPMDDQSSEPEPNTATITPVSSTPARIDLTVDNATLVDSIRNSGRVLAKGPRLKNAKAYIATRSLAVCGMKVDEALQHQYRNNKGAKANYRISDLAYDIKRQHLVTLDTQQVAVLQAFAPDHSKDLLTAEDHKAIKSVHEMYPGMPVRVDMEGELYEFREARPCVVKNVKIGLRPLKKSTTASSRPVRGRWSNCRLTKLLYRRSWFSKRRKIASARLKA
jgi:transposase InsO family protein